MTARALRAIGRLPHPPAWLNRRLVTQVVAALDMRAARPGALFVGGCVRDALLRQPRDTLDVDVATVHPPPEVQQRLHRAGVRTATMGLAHGTITALPARGEPGSVDVTTLRRDVRTFGRSADVAFSEDWIADAERRDFTINALYADPDLRVFGASDLGLRDLARGHVRFIGVAAQRIHEDYLRILRYFRMFAWFGGPTHDRVNLNAIAKSLPGLHHVSGERLRAELLRLLAAAQPVPAVAAMAATGTLQRVVGDWSNPASPTARRRLRTLDQLVQLERRLGLEDPGRRLCTLVDTGPGVVDASSRLRLSKAETRRFRQAAAGGAPAHTCPEARRHVWEAGGSTPAVDRLLLGAARTGSPRPDAARRLVRHMQTWDPPTFPLGGADVVKLGVPPGPGRQALLRAVEGWWADGDFAPGRDRCLDELQRRADGRNPARAPAETSSG